MACAISDVQGSLGCCVKHVIYNEEVRRKHEAYIDKLRMKATKLGHSKHASYKALQKKVLGLSAQDLGPSPTCAKTELVPGPA